MADEVAKHTPGPWEIEDPLGPETIWIVEAGKETHEWRAIAMLPASMPDDAEEHPLLMPERDANARLIAAAPDMLEALRLHAAYEALPTDRGGKHGPKGKAHAAWIAARDAALSKTES